MEAKGFSIKKINSEGFVYKNYVFTSWKEETQDLIK